MNEISVIVPYYNSTLFLFRKCIESILKQTFSDFELLIVIDGSKKNYLPIQQKYERDKRVKFYYQQNKGVSAARNLGIDKATGKYLSFIDSDDYIEETFLAKLYNAIERYDLAICGIAEQNFPTAYARMDKRVFSSMPAEYCWLQYTNFSVNKLYRADIINGHNIRFDTNVKLGEDAIFLSQYFIYCKNIASIPDGLYHYIPNDTSATRTYYREYWIWEKQVIKKQWEFFHIYPLCKREAEYMYYWLFAKIHGAFTYYLENDRENAMKYLREITKEPLYNELLAQKLSKGEFFKKKNLITLDIWRRFGLTGINSYYLLRRQNF